MNYDAVFQSLAGHFWLGRLALVSAELIVLSLAVAGAIRLLRIRSPRLQALLWLVVLAKPVFGLAFGAPAPLWRVAQPAPASAISQTAGGSMNLDDLLRQQREVMASIDADAAAGGMHAAKGNAHAAALLRSKGAAAHGLSWRAMPWGSLAGGIWIAGAAFLLALSASDLIRLRRMLRRCAEPEAQIVQQYESLAQGMGIARPPRLKISEALESPALVGLFSPAILLPRWMAEEAAQQSVGWVLTHQIGEAHAQNGDEQENGGSRPTLHENESSGPERLEWMFRHELTHWKHGDALGLAVRRLAEILFYFHPAVWWAGKKWEEAMELACDRALLETEPDAKHYAEHLYRVLEKQRNRRRLALSSGLFATRSQIGRRIEALLGNPFRSPARLSAWALACVCVVAVACLSLGIGFERRAQAQTAQTRAFTGNKELDAQIIRTGVGSLPSNKDLQILFKQRQSLLNAVMFDYTVKTIYPKETVSENRSEPATQNVKFYFDGHKSLLQQSISGKCCFETGFDGTNTRVVRHGDTHDDMTISSPSDGTLANAVSPRWFVDRVLNIAPVTDLLVASDVKITEKGNFLQVQGSLLGGGYWADVLLDSSKDFAIKRIDAKLHGFLCSTSEVLDFEKVEVPAGDIVVPKHITITFFQPSKEGGILFTKEIYVNIMQVVDKFPENLFIPKTGDNVAVWDDTLKTGYKIDLRTENEVQSTSTPVVTGNVEIDHKLDKTKSGLRSIATALEAYNVDWNTYPEAYRQLTTPVAYISKVLPDPFAPSRPLDFRYTAAFRYDPDFNTYVIYGVGPDAVDQKAELAYDPTNGTVSPGDVIRKMERNPRLQGDLALQNTVILQQADLATIQTAIEAWYVDRNSLPPQLTDLLAPKAYLPRLPEDRFAPGQPLHYILDGPAGKATVYSVGPDGDDDGGRMIVGRTRTGQMPDLDIAITVVMNEMAKRLPAQTTPRAAPPPVGYSYGRGSAPAAPAQSTTPVVTGNPDIDSRLYRTQSDLRSIAIALECYKVDNNAYPKAYHQLTTPISYITAQPHDPFASSRFLDFRYSPKLNSVLIYSVGPDGVDQKAELVYDPTNGTVSAGDVSLTTR